MTSILIIPAPAKLNLYLHINKKLSNGYHSLESFIIFVNLFDTITVKESNLDSFKIIGTLSNNLKQNCNLEDNLVYKIIAHVKKKYNINKCVDVTLNKNIPIGAGLAGGSSDAAAIFKALNILWRLNLSNSELSKESITFGADIPSCIYSESGLITGIGEKYTEIPLNFNLPILLVSSLNSLNTKEVYSNLNLENINNDNKSTYTNKNYNKAEFLKYLKTQTNDLTPAAINLLPSLKTLIADLNSTNPIIARMTGSGSSCFAIYSNFIELQTAYNIIKKIHPEYLISKVTNLIN